MPQNIFKLKNKLDARTYCNVLNPARTLLNRIPCLAARGNRPLQMTFEDQLNILVYFHLQEHQSGRHLLQALEEDDFAREIIAPKGGIKKSSFFEAINTRGLEQFVALYEALSAEAAKILPKKHTNMGDLVAIDGSFIDAVLSMEWASYQGDIKKAKTHVGFNINQGIPTKIFLTDGKADERPFVSKILDKGQTGLMDRYYHRHKSFDQWQEERKHFICRIRTATVKTLIRANEVAAGGIVFYDAVVFLGRDGTKSKKETRVVGYKVNGKEYWVATDRHDLSAEDVAAAYKLRWDIETFFGWWKQHLKVYHLIARTEYGLKIQILAGLITYLLLAIYCHNEYKERVSITRVRELQFKIKNEALVAIKAKARKQKRKGLAKKNLYAKT